MFKFIKVLYVWLKIQTCSYSNMYYLTLTKKIYGIKKYIYRGITTKYNPLGIHNVFFDLFMQTKCLN